MEKEQIVKALECCAATSAEACRECPVDQSIKDDCRCCSFLAGNALGIIREQEKQIDELAAVVERRVPRLRRGLSDRKNGARQMPHLLGGGIFRRTEGREQLWQDLT